MSWIAAGTAAAGVVGAAMNSGSSDGGTTTTKSEPWAPAQDWLKSNLQTGQSLQKYYQDNPFNDQQKAAYANLASGTDYINRLTPGLLQQFSQPTGFDRKNPNAKPQAYNFQALFANPYSLQSSPQSSSQAYGGVMQNSNPINAFVVPPASAYAAPATSVPTTPAAPEYRGRGVLGTKRLVK